MKKASTFYAKQAGLLYELVASVKEIYYAITQLTGQDRIQLSEYESDGIVEYASGFACVYRDGEPVMVKHDSSQFRDSNIYDLGVAAIVDLYAELEEIYKYEKKHCQTA